MPIEYWTEPSGLFGMGAGPVSPISTGVNAGVNATPGMFNAALGPLAVIGAFANFVGGRADAADARRAESERLRALALDNLTAMGRDPREEFSPENLAATMTDYSWADDANMTMEDVSANLIMNRVQDYIANPDRFQPKNDGYVLTNDGMTVDGNVVGTPPLFPVSDSQQASSGGSSGGGGGGGGTSGGQSGEWVDVNALPRDGSIVVSQHTNPDGQVVATDPLGETWEVSPPVTQEVTPTTSEVAIDWQAVIRDWLANNPNASPEEIASVIARNNVPAEELAKAGVGSGTGTGAGGGSGSGTGSGGGGGTGAGSGGGTGGSVGGNAGGTGSGPSQGPGVVPGGVGTGPGGTNPGNTGNPNNSSSFSPTRTTDSLFKNELLQWDNTFIPLVRNTFYTGR